MMKKILGIELGDQWIKIVELKQRGQFWDVKAAAKVETPRGVIEDGEVLGQQKLYLFLKEQLDKLGIKTKKVCIRISSRQILTKYMPLQAHSVKEAKKMVKDKKKLYFPVEGDYVIDAAITGEKRGQELGALLVAAPNRVVQPIMSLVDQLGLKAMSISIPSYGYCKQFESETALVVDIGASMSTLTCVAQGTCKVVNHVNFGMQDVDRALCDEFGSGEHVDVNRFYEKHMMLLAELDLEPSRTEFVSHYVSTVVGEVLEERLLSEIQNMMVFYEGLESGNKVEKLYVVGDCGRIKGITQYIERQLGVPTAFLVPGGGFEERSLRRVRQDLPAFANILCLSVASA